MAELDFDPNSVSSKNAGIYGLPHTPEQATVSLLPVPWDVTTSYHAGAAQGPEIIREASAQVDLYHPDFPRLWRHGVYMSEAPGWIMENNRASRAKAERIIDQLETGAPLAAEHQTLQAEVNESAAKVTAWLKSESLKALQAGKLPGVVGGDHSAPLGLMQALAEHHGEYGILHFDAHHDYRDSYMGFSESHASIMHNAAKIPQISKFVQVGIRDYCEDEVQFAQTDPQRFITFYDQQLKESAFHGKIWHHQCEEIVANLPEKIYISFDIDGLAPHLCPGTGTPVPGGLSYEQAVYLIKLASQSHTIVGFDVVEVAGHADSIDANIGARLLWNISGYALNSQQR